MSHISGTIILIALLFGICGFAIVFFLKRSIGFFLLAALLYAAFKGFEKMSYQPDWSSFDKLISLLQQMAKTLLIMFNNMVATAGVFSIAFFLTGGVLGLIIGGRR